MRVGWSSVGADRREKSRLLTAVGLGFFLLIAIRLFYIQVLNTGEYRTLAQGNFLRPEVIPAMRGMIRDRHGTLLAGSLPSFTVSIDPFDEAFRTGPGRRPPRARLENCVAALAGILGANPDTLLRTVRSQMTASYQPVRIRRNLEMATVSVIAERRDELPGVVVEMEPLRSYPFGAIGAHILGYLNEVTDQELAKLRGKGYFPGASIGRSGIERSYEEVLKGEDGFRFVEVNALGRRSNYFVSVPPVLPRAGRDLVLSVDWKLQLAAEAALDSAGWSGPPPPPETRGAVVAMDPRNGEILALASRPAFDPNEFSAGIPATRWAELNQPGRFPLLNRAVQARYPPGSTFKPVTLLAGLEEGKIRPSSVLHGCGGGWNYGSRYFRCWKAGGHGSSDAERALMVSCDVYFYQVGAMVGVDGIAAMARRMHVTEPTGIDLPQEKRGFVPDAAWYDRQYGPRGWSRGAALNLAIGQGEIGLTPVELASLAASLATGKVPRPHLVRQVALQAGQREIVPDTTARAALDVNRMFLETVRRGMVDVVQGPEGTARRAKVDSVNVAGKTGSAQHPGDPTHALFICFAPAERPEIVVAVVLEQRGGGGAFAAPVAHAVLDHYFHPDRYVPRPDTTAVPADTSGVRPDTTVVVAAGRDTLDDVPPPGPREGASRPDTLGDAPPPGPRNGAPLPGAADDPPRGGTP